MMLILHIFIIDRCFWDLQYNTVSGKNTTR